MTQLQQDTFIISKEQENCITVYPGKTWHEKIGYKILELPHGNPVANRIRRRVGQSTTETGIDGQGRITIPQDYIEHAKIAKIIRIIGTVDTLQLWNPELDNEIAPPEEPEKPLMEELNEFDI
jgi:MraZ protein